MKYRPTFQAIELIPGIASGANSSSLSTPNNLQNQPNHSSIHRQRNDQNPEYPQNDGLFENSSSPIFLLKPVSLPKSFKRRFQASAL
ncbi:MAG: hypothetical protein R3B93_23075 [Bacteroidia bacterium]